jgi:hypothetical protein
MLRNYFLNSKGLDEGITPGDRGLIEAFVGVEPTEHAGR